MKKLTPEKIKTWENFLKAHKVKVKTSYDPTMRVNSKKK